MDIDEEPYFDEEMADEMDNFDGELEERKAKLSAKPDSKVLAIAIKCGPDLNEVTDYFPAYDVALKLQKNGWTPTEKQRKAIINVTAFYQTKKYFRNEENRTDNGELKSCPFCGGRVERTAWYDKTDRLECEDCDAIIYWDEKTDKEAEALWNRRAHENDE